MWTCPASLVGHFCRYSSEWYCWPAKCSVSSAKTCCAKETAVTNHGIALCSKSLRQVLAGSPRINCRSKRAILLSLVRDGFAFSRSCVSSQRKTAGSSPGRSSVFSNSAQNFLRSTFGQSSSVRFLTRALYQDF